MYAPPLVDGDEVHVIDSFGGIFSIDPASGRAQRTGTLQLGDATVVLPTPVADGTGYVTAQSVVGAVELPGGGTEWEAEVPGAIYQPATIAGDALVVPSSSETELHLSVFDRSTGELRWHERVGDLSSEGATTGAAVSGDVVFGGDPLTARSLDDGSVVWRSRERDLIGSVLVLDGDTVVAGTGEFETRTGSGAVVAVDARTGERQWRAAAPGTPPDPLADLLVDPDADRIVLQSGDGRTLLGIDAVTGTRAWERELPARRLGSGAAIEGLLWFPLTDGRVLALDPADGATLGQSPSFGVDLTDQALAQRPVEAGGVVIVPAGLALLGLDAGLLG